MYIMEESNYKRRERTQGRDIRIETISKELQRDLSAE